MRKCFQIGNIAVALLVQLCFSFEVKFLRVLKDKQLANHAIYSISNLTEVQCLYECSQRLDCGSVNYHVTNKVCVMNNDAKNEEEKELNTVDGIGWKYMEKSKIIEKEVIKESGEFNIIGDHQPMKGKLINIIPVQLEFWEISFDMIIYKKTSDITNIFHFTIGNDNTHSGDRTPALFLRDDILYFKFAKYNMTRISYKSKSMPLSTKKNIKIMQHLCSGRQEIEISIDNVEVFSAFNQQPSKFVNVKCYLGDPWYQPAPVLVSNFTYTSRTICQNFSQSDFAIEFLQPTINVPVLPNKEIFITNEITSTLWFYTNAADNDIGVGFRTFFTMPRILGSEISSIQILFQSQQRISMWLKDRRIHTPTGTFQLGRWNHLAATCRQIDSSYINVIFYINGEQIFTATTTGTLKQLPIGAPYRGFVLGNDVDGNNLNDPNQYFPGKLSKLYIYNAVLTIAQIRNIYNGIYPTENQVLSWMEFYGTAQADARQIECECTNT